MRCVFHQEQEAEVLCSICKRPICRSCSIELAGSSYCRPCLEKRVESVKVPVGEVKSRFWAFVLSLFPGGGYLYLGLMKRGLQAMILFFGSIFIGAILGMGELIALVVPIVMFYTIFDTQAIWRRMQQGIPVEDEDLVDLGLWEQRSTVAAYALIVIGALALLNNMIPVYYFMGIIRRVFPPLLIMGLGVYILYRNTRKEAVKDE